MTTRDTWSRLYVLAVPTAATAYSIAEHAEDPIERNNRKGY